MKNRKELLQDLLMFQRPEELESLRAGLEGYGWDSDEVLVTLTGDVVIALLTRYLAGQLTERQVAEWAWTVEGREDVSLQGKDSDSNDIFLAIAELANPETEGVLTSKKAREIIDTLVVD